MLDLQVLFGSEGKILLDVALRINDGGGAGWFVADEVGGMGETIQIELFEDQVTPLSVLRANAVLKFIS